MATTVYTLNTSTWTAISAAGTSGACWLKTGGRCVIDHSTAAAPSLTKAYTLSGGLDGSLSISITADGGTDIFYAMAIATTNTDPVVLISDVI